MSGVHYFQTTTMTSFRKLTMETKYYSEEIRPYPHISKYTFSPEKTRALIEDYP
jgi:hypothetical protein